jgi:mono/diheme cytochrome c family protein
MTPVASALVGLVFLGLAFASTFLMFHLWGYPFDKTTRTSAAPRSLMLLHRCIGYLYAAVYVFMMIRMVPRMWEYQVELPPRTVAHLLLGFSIGMILILKISIVRFFRHLEEWMPYLGTALLLFTVLLLGLSLPFAFRERALAAGARGGDVFSESNRQRVAQQIAIAEVDEAAKKADLASTRSFVHGRAVLLEKCVKCHDLKTILARPRSASDWFQTSERMAEKPALFAPLSQEDVYAVSGYLIAITPDLQKSRKLKREQEEEHEETREEMAELTGESKPPAEVAPAEKPTGKPPAEAAPAEKPEPAKPRTVVAPDPVKAKAAYERVCSGCHELSDIDDVPPKSEASAQKLITRMIENGLTAKQSDLKLVKWYLVQYYVKKPL